MRTDPAFRAYIRGHRSSTIDTVCPKVIPMATTGARSLIYDASDDLVKTCWTESHRQLDRHGPSPNFAHAQVE